MSRHYRASVRGQRDMLRNRIYDYLTKPFEVEQLKGGIIPDSQAVALSRKAWEQIGFAIRERQSPRVDAGGDGQAHHPLGYMSQIELARTRHPSKRSTGSPWLRVRLAELFQSIQVY